jgi:Glycosyl hydrolases family 2, sugar binding domain/Glycosyl hydrolases family 2, TIM barrel domain/Glycosyl hydrolases family 2
MSSRSVLLSLILCALIGSPAGADWKPAPGPLLTRWAREVSPDRVHPEYPRPQMRRERWQSLNGLWQYAAATEGETPPHGQELSSQILVPFPVESALSGVMHHFERIWYRRTFDVPKEWAGQRILLHFGAVDWEASVWINGQKLGSHRGGYDGFSFDVTEALKPQVSQELIVGVWDPTDGGPQPRGKQVLKPSGIYYTPTTGIWQSVWLEPVPAASIASLRIVPDVDGAAVRVSVQIAGKDNGLGLRATASAGKMSVTAEGTPGTELTLSIPSPRLWSPDDPFLYDLAVELRSGGKTVDHVDSYFGMRKISVGPDEKGVTRLLLNGKPVFQVGPLDQGFWPDGLYTAPTDEALKFDVEMTRKLGFNMTRKHVKVEPDRWYYWCDKLGLLVWQDMPSGDRSVAPRKDDLVRTPESARQYETELLRMIDGRHNHPCIVMWVVFNEGWGQFDTARITRLTKEHDPTRLVNCASGWNDRAVGDVHDIHVYPGPGSPDPEPKRAAVLGEFGGLGLKVDGHTWSAKTWGYRGTSDREDLTRKYERLLRAAYELRDRRGLSAAVYTQLTDVETEANGLFTYDREVLKVEPDRVAAVNRGDFSKVLTVTKLVATSVEKGQPWRFTLDHPGTGWFKPGFDDSAWKEGVGGFGSHGTPGAVVRTEWKTADVYLRRSIELASALRGEVRLLLHHDEDAEVYLNGVLAAKVAGYITDYEEVPILPEARSTLKPGKNLLAVHCHQTTGGQYIDVGLVEVGAK